MTVKTHRFGEIEVSDEDIINFPEGLVGLTRFKRFVMLRDPESEKLVWLQSIDSADLSLATMHSASLLDDYRVELRPDDVASIGLDNSDFAEVFVIINRIEGKFFANLRGPLIIHSEKMLGKQVVLRNPEYQVRHPLSSDLEAAQGSRARKSESAHVSITARS